MRLVVAGTPAVAVPALEAIAASSHELLAVVTRPDAPSGRGRKLVRSEVGRWADEHDVPVLAPVKPSDEGFRAELAALAPDCVPVIAYGALVPRSLLDLPKHGWVNLHFSLLPAWRGAAPVQRAVMAGDEVTGAAVFELEAGLDTGPVYGVMTEVVRPRDTSGDLLGRLAEGGAGLLVRVLDGIADGSLQAVPQPGEGISLAPKVTVEEARVDWTLPAVAVDRRVRGLTPEPGAWTTWRGERLRLGPVLPVPPLDEAAALAAGEVLVLKKEVRVGTASGPVVLGTVQPPGKKPMAAVDWARGARIEPGEVLS